jgi:hypothetical protein
VQPATITPGWPAVPDWTQGDPGWDNIGINTDSLNGVYLGDNWVLTARHVAAANITFSTGTFTRIGSQNFIVRNPPPNLANGASLTTETDLRLYRVNGNVGLPALTIASESPPLTGNSGSQVMFIGHGRIRHAEETHWSINQSSPPPTAQGWGDAEVPSGGNTHGYKTNSTPRPKRWGTNRLENPSSSAFESDVFDETISPTTAVLPLTTGPSDNRVTRDVISMVTTFNPQSDSSALPFESQAVSSDSGGAVFYNRGTAQAPDWVLSGIVNATIVFGEGQPQSYAIYGNSTTFADLSYYNQPYQHSICDIMKSCGAYSVMGDVNLDGDVTGNGTGPTSLDDVSAFVAGWGHNNLAGRGDYATWTKGDLNLNGVTDAEDFLLLREALHGPINSGVMVSLFGAVPEPSTAILLLLGSAPLAVSRRRRHGR